MRIYTKAGDLAHSSFTFPDGQPHFKLETHEIEFRSVTVETAIRNSDELVQTLLVSQVLRQQGYSEINLDIRYLLGARMDRAIGPDQPFTLDCVARLINGAGFTRVRILDAHSEVSTRLIRNSTNLLPYEVLRHVMVTLGAPVVVCPDKGAYDRVWNLTHKIGSWSEFIQCSKVRDPQTGKLSGFKVHVPPPADKFSPFDCLIVDDICDGGGTFVGLAAELRKAGAKRVYLFVTHGIFSKGLPLEGIDQVYTTNSYHVSIYDTPVGPRYAVTIPISMKDIK